MKTRQASFLIGGAAALVAASWILFAVRSATPTCAEARSPRGAGQAPLVRFEARDVLVDVGETRLAAYQLELIDLGGRTVVVGVEGGESEAFRTPPYYDSAALAKGRLILAAFSTAEDLPSGRTRVARVHLQIEGDRPPRLEVKLTLAADAEGRTFEAEATLEETKR